MGQRLHGVYDGGMSMSFVEFKDVKKVYHMGEVDIEALRGVSFEIEK